MFAVTTSMRSHGSVVLSSRGSSVETRRFRRTGFARSASVSAPTRGVRAVGHLGIITSDECSEPKGAARTLGQRAASALAALSLSASSVGSLTMATAPPASAATKGPSGYVAELMPTKGNKVSGSFTFRTVLNASNQEQVEITVDVRGLTPGEHGVNIHSEGGDLTCDDGSCTGESYNPDQVPHGGPNSLKKFGASACHFVGEGCLLWRHIGDLGNVTADGTGAVSTTFKDPYISLKDGKKGSNSNVAGRSIVVRAGADDFVTTENDGGAGPIVAYGVLKPV